MDDRERDLRRAEQIYDQWSVKIRDTILYVVGVAGIINEVWLVPEPRITLLVFLGSLVGLPVLLRADERRPVKKDTGNGSEK